MGLNKFVGIYLYKDLFLNMLVASMLGGVVAGCIVLFFAGR